MKRAVWLSLLLLLLLSACGTKSYTSSDLAQMLPGKSDAPKGLQFVAESSGSRTVDQIAKDGSEKTELMSFGFRAGYTTFFASTGALATLSQKTASADPSSRIFIALGMIFRSSGGARRAMALEHANDLAASTRVSTVSIGTKIGQETIVESGTQSGSPFPGYLMYWRERNALFAVLVVGGPDVLITIAGVTNIAKAIESRALNPR